MPRKLRTLSGWLTGTTNRRGRHKGARVSGFRLAWETTPLCAMYGLSRLFDLLPWVCQNFSQWEGVRYGPWGY